MILNGKAKEDFKKYIYNIRHMYDNSLTSQKYALIIEWFDSVGIYVNISPNYLDHERKYSEGDFKAIINFKDGRNTMGVDFPFESCFNPCNRQEATKQAILKANEIYNSNF